MREYRAEESARMQDPDGLALADFWQRAAAFATDVAIAIVAVALFIWGAARWAIETGVRVVSLVRQRMSLWHPIERAHQFIEQR